MSKKFTSSLPPHCKSWRHWLSSAQELNTLLLKNSLKNPSWRFGSHYSHSLIPSTHTPFWKHGYLLSVTAAEPDTMHQTSVAQSSGLHSFSAYVEQFRSVLHPKSQLETLYIIYSWMSSLKTKHCLRVLFTTWKILKMYTRTARPWMQYVPLVWGSHPTQTFPSSYWLPSIPCSPPQCYFSCWLLKRYFNDNCFSHRSRGRNVHTICYSSWSIYVLFNFPLKKKKQYLHCSPLALDYRPASFIWISFFFKRKNHRFKEKSAKKSFQPKFVL